MLRRENILITEDYMSKTTSATHFTAPGEIEYFDSSIHFGKESDRVEIQNCNIKNNVLVHCSKEDTYDFEVGALIALMKMCGSDKVVRACNEAFSYETDIKVLRKDNNNLREANKGLQEEVKRLKGESESHWKNYQRNIQKKQDRINELERAYKASNDDKAKLVEYYQREIKKFEEEIKNLKGIIDELFESEQHSKTELGRLYFEKHRLEEKVEKLKLDCEKLQHGYNNTDLIFCGGRQNGKQYTALVDLFKKIDQKKVDAAYKEAYNTTLPVWQKEVLNQMYGVYKESKGKTELPRTLDINGTTYRKSIQIKDFSNDQLDSLIEGSRAFTRMFDSEWLKPPTKREEMWNDILGASKCPPVEIKVAKEDVTSFLRELQDKIPETRWNGSDCPPLEYTNPYWFKHDYIYFALFRNDVKGNLRICYDEKPYSWINKPVIIYLPPMRWDLFKKGRLVIGVKNNNELVEFRKEVERNTGIKNIPMCPTNLCLFYSFDKDDYKIILVTIGEPNSAKINNHKVVYWEDVR